MNKIEVEARLFNLYSALFCQPEEELFDHLKILEQLEQSQNRLINSNDEGNCELRKACLQYSSKEILVDYTKIFHGPFKAVAHPYSSVYLSEGNKTLNNESTQWVEEFYRTCGYSFGKSVKDMPDHIAVELEFLYLMKFNQVSLLKNEHNEKAIELESKYIHFLENHFNVWIPKFCDKIISDVENKYYVLLCKWLKDFVLKHLMQELELFKLRNN